VRAVGLFFGHRHTRKDTDNDEEIYSKVFDAGGFVGAGKAGEAGPGAVSEPAPDGQLGDTGKGAGVGEYELKVTSDELTARAAVGKLGGSEVRRKG